MLFVQFLKQKVQKIKYWKDLDMNEIQNCEFWNFNKKFCLNLNTATSTSRTKLYSFEKYECKAR